MALPRRMAVGNAKNLFGHFSMISEKNEKLFSEFFSFRFIFFQKNKLMNAHRLIFKKFHIPNTSVIKIFLEFFIINFFIFNIL